jgi:hypothetical protein
MTFAAPMWLAAAFATALLVFGLHLLTRRRPRPIVFPTTRFIPDRTSSAAAPSTRPSDLVLLLVRVLAVLFLGLALAQPHWSSSGRTSRIVLLDQSRLAPPVVDSSTDSLLRSADMVIGFDTVARRLTPDEWRTPTDRARAPGALSVALLSALRASSAIARRGDSVSLTIVSPFGQEEWDEATADIRALWPGGIVLVPRPARAGAAVVRPTSLLAPDDPLAATTALLDSGEIARVVRGDLSSHDSADARSGAAIVHWPRDLARTNWLRATGDTSYGVYSTGIAVVAPFIRVVSPPPGVPVASWVDGRPAATEVSLGSGCIRSIAIPVASVGDFAIRPNLVAMTRELLGPCGGEVVSTPLAKHLLDQLRGSASMAPAGKLSPASVQAFPANRLMLILALGMLLLELLLRRKSGGQ